MPGGVAVRDQGGFARGLLDVGAEELVKLLAAHLLLQGGDRHQLLFVGFEACFGDDPGAGGFVGELPVALTFD